MDVGIQTELTGIDIVVVDSAFIIQGSKDHVFLVGSIGDGLADMDVVKTRFVILHGNVDHNHIRDLDELQLAVFLDVVQVSAGRIDTDIDLTGLQGDQAGGSFLEELEDDTAGGSCAAAVIFVADEGDIVTRDPVFNGEHAGTDPRTFGLVSGDQFLGHDGHAAVSHQQKEFLICAGKGDNDCVVIRNLNVNDIADFRVRKGRIFSDGVSESYVIGCAGCAIGEGHAGGNVEGESFSVFTDFPGICQTGDDIAGFRIDLDQRFMSERESHHVGVSVGCLRIQCRDIVRNTDRDGIL